MPQIRKLTTNKIILELSRCFVECGIITLETCSLLHHIIQIVTKNLRLSRTEMLITAICLHIISGIHAREWIAPSVATFIMRTLVENHRNNQDLTDFFDFYILPVANPDG